MINRSCYATGSVVRPFGSHQRLQPKPLLLLLAPSPISLALIALDDPCIDGLLLLLLPYKLTKSS